MENSKAMENNVIISDINCYISVCSMIDIKVTKCKSLHGDVYILYKDGYIPNGIILGNKLYENIDEVFVTNEIDRYFIDELEGYIINKEVWFIINKTAFILSDWKLKELKELIKDSIQDNVTFEQIQKVFSTSIPLFLGLTGDRMGSRSRIKNDFLNLIKYNDSIYTTRFFGRLNNSSKQIIITVDSQLYLLSGTGDYYRLNLKDSDREHLNSLGLLGDLIGTVVYDNFLVFEDTIIDTKEQQIIISKSGKWDNYIKIGYLIEDNTSTKQYNILTNEAAMKLVPDNLLTKCKFKQKRLSEKEFIAELSNSVI